jgi:flagellar hook assembly protein FlgD
LSDKSVEPGTTYRYRVNVVDEAGSRTLFETDAISMPAMPLTLHQNHPNPFNPSTTIGYYLPVDSPVTLDVYDSSGRLVARLLNAAKQAKGTHSVTWNGADAQGRGSSSGVYFYRLTSGKETISRKMILLR